MASRVPANMVNKRREARIAVDLPARLLSYRRQREVRIRDVSANGAMVSGGDLPDLGDEIVLSRDGFEVVATVAWAVAPNCGLSFHRSIDLRAIVAGA